MMEAATEKSYAEELPEKVRNAERVLERAIRAKLPTRDGIVAGTCRAELGRQYTPSERDTLDILDIETLALATGAKAILYVLESGEKYRINTEVVAMARGRIQRREARRNMVAC